MTRKTVLFFCCFAALTTAPAWGESPKENVVYKCPVGQYAIGSEVTKKGDSVCESGFSSTSTAPAVYAEGCARCPKIVFDGNAQDTSSQKVTTPIKSPPKVNPRQYGTTNPDRYRPALQKNCYIPRGSTEYEDETGTFTLAGNCYYTGPIPD